MSILFIVLDGATDRRLNGKTPFEKAKMPNITKLLKTSQTGLLDILGPGIPPGSDTGHWALFGYTEPAPGRGIFEAYGQGVAVGPGEVALRANMALVEKTDKGYMIKKRRAECDWSKVASLNINGVDVRAVHTVEHRGLVVLKGNNQITDSDPGVENSPVAKILPKVKSAEETAKILNEYCRRVYLTYNNGSFLLLRGAGAINDAPSFESKWGLKSACVAGGPMYKGIAKYLGMKIIEVKGALGSTHSDFRAKYNAAVDALKSNDFVFLHIKATDKAGHNKDHKQKVEMLEKVDKAFAGIDKLKATVVITSDHATPTVGLSHHSGDPVALLISSPGIISDKTKKFTEFDCAKGALGRIPATAVMPIVLDLEDKSKEVSFDLTVPSKPYFSKYETL